METPALPVDLIKAGADPTFNYIENVRLVKKINWIWEEIQSHGFYPEARFAPGAFVSGAGLRIDGHQLFETKETFPDFKYDIFGGITRCDDVARGLLMALESHPPRVPLVVRLIGTNEERARKLLQGSALRTAAGMDEVVQKAIAAAREAEGSA